MNYFLHLFGSTTQGDTKKYYMSSKPRNFDGATKAIQHYQDSLKYNTVDTSSELYQISVTAFDNKPFYIYPYRTSRLYVSK